MSLASEPEIHWTEYLRGWWFPGLVVTIGVMFLLGAIVSRPPSPKGLKKAFDDPFLDFNKRMIRAWEDDITPETEKERCRQIGAILREVERQDYYTYRLFLVLPKEPERDFFVINDGGICWENGEERRPILEDPRWLEEFFKSGKHPGELPVRPFRRLPGIWTLVPVRQYTLTWGALLAQHQP